MQTFAIIPAAGRSQRMGNPKLLLPWGERTLIEHVLGAWQRGGVEQRIVVVHPDDQQLAKVCQNAGAIVCRPTTPPPEMKDSVQAGLTLAQELFRPTAVDAWLLAPADLPFLSPELVRLLINQYRQSRPPIVAPRLPTGQIGHPVLFSWLLATATGQLTQGVKELLESHPVTFIEWDNATTFDDLDTSDDYRRLHDRYNS